MDIARFARGQAVAVRILVILVYVAILSGPRSGVIGFTAWSSSPSWPLALGVSEYC
jgi:hypothetical protein